MLSIDRFGELVDPGGTLEEEELRALRQEIHNLAEVLVEIASDRLVPSQGSTIVATTTKETGIN
jgi:hypothetical protein